MILYYSDIKKKWNSNIYNKMDVLEVIVLSELNQAQKDK